MRKVYLNQINEDWVVDRFRKEWYQFNSEISSEKINNSDIVWIIAPWTWKKLSKRQLLSKKVICTIHHIDFDKFGKKEEKDFYNRDKFVDEYHVISDKTKKQVEKLTTKKINVIPFWVNQNNFFEIDDKNLLRNKYKIQQNSYVLGSFQRDTEGYDLKSPKLSKGPDRFLNIVLDMNKTQENLEVVLTGKRRQFLIENFNKYKIKYHYFEMTDFHTLNELYNLLDLYIVASRVEGGPRSLFECAISRTPIISTDVGFASNILSNNSIFKGEDYKKAIPDVNYSRNIVNDYLIPEGFDNFIRMYSEIYES